MDPDHLEPVQFKFEHHIEWTDIREECIGRLRSARDLNIPHLPELQAHDYKCAIVGAGPSVVDYVDKIREIQGTTASLIMTVNAAHDWLLRHDIAPNIHVVFETDLTDVKTALGGEPDNRVTYYVASHCAQSVFDQLSYYKRVLWHSFLDIHEYQQSIDRFFPHEFMVGGGFATFFRCLTIARILGYRDFELFGMDSSFTESSHLDGYSMANIEKVVTLWGRDGQTGELKQFTTNGALAFQAKEFLEFCRCNQDSLKLCVNGNGLLRYLHQSRYPEQYERS
jgi:hypothetical protein